MEFEGNPWRQQKWLQVFGEEIRAALVENSAVWAPVSDSSFPSLGGTSPSLWPALVNTHFFSRNLLYPGSV